MLLRRNRAYWRTQLIYATSLLLFCIWHHLIVQSLLSCVIVSIHCNLKMTRLLFSCIIILLLNRLIVQLHNCLSSCSLLRCNRPIFQLYLKWSHRSIIWLYLKLRQRPIVQLHLKLRHMPIIQLYLQWRHRTIIH